MTWIRIEDRLPSNNQDIIAWGPALIKPFQMTFRREWDNPFVTAIIGSFDEVTHWMPLPIPPEINNDLD